jgi:hypothetical protein
MSTVILDTITGKSTATTITIGSTPVVSASANSMTIRGEGTAQTSIQQGLAKHWNQFVQSNASVADSFNQSSATDEGTGDTSWDFTNAMGNDDYSSQTTCNSGSYQFTSSYNDAQKTTAGDRCYSMTAASGIADATTVFVTTHGDLA